MSDKSPVEEFDPNAEIVVVGKKVKRFNISSFRTEMNRNEILKTNSFLVNFAPFNDSDLNRYEDMMTLRCDSAILPSIALLKEENVRRYGYGPVETVAHGVQFGQARLTWIVDRDAEVVQFFKKWFMKIVNFNSFGGADMTTDADNGFSPYEIGYKDSYSNSKITIYVYDNSSQTIMQYELYDAFPLMTEDIPLAWAEMDSIIKFSVSFAFTDMQIRFPAQETLDQDILYGLTQTQPRGSAEAYTTSYRPK